MLRPMLTMMLGGGSVRLADSNYFGDAANDDVADDDHDDDTDYDAGWWVCQVNTNVLMLLL